MQRLLFLVIVSVLGVSMIKASDPTSTKYSTDECLGTSRPYPDVETVISVPDSLTPVFMNYVGRHGSLFLPSAKTAKNLLKLLQQADSAGTLGEKGKSLLVTVAEGFAASNHRWGALDSLGIAEQRGIASRLWASMPSLFDEGAVVNARSSYSPRCVMSMYEFTHQLLRMNNDVELRTSSGRSNSALLRPFDVSQDYVEWYKTDEWKAPYNMFFETTAPAAPARRLFTDEANAGSNSEAQQLSWEMYKVLSGFPAMNLAVDFKEYFTADELNALWACENMGHYLRRSGTTISTEPAMIASDLLLDLIETTDAAVAGKGVAKVQLRFAHAETLMPLLSMLHLKGCYYMTNYFDTVALHWKDFYIAPMSGNLQMALFVNKKGVYYVRFALNEQVLPLIPNSDNIYVKWDVAREYLMHCLPMHLQIWNE